MAERMWYYLQENEQVGPIPQEELLRMLSQGVLPRTTYVWAEGMGQWQPASEIPELGGQVPAGGTGYGPAYGMPSQGLVRPASVTVFGILNIIFGALGLLCSPFGLIAVFIPQQQGMPADWTI